MSATAAPVAPSWEKSHQGPLGLMNSARQTIQGGRGSYCPESGICCKLALDASSRLQHVSGIPAIHALGEAAPYRE
jgi:hypothetical protein